MSTTDPTGDRGGGGGGGGGGLASITPTDDNVTPVTSSTGVAVSPASHHHQHPPPSPLSGCYLLVVLPEPHTAQHKDLILNRLAKGFLSWDKDSCHVDLEKELQALVAQAPEGEEARNGERLIQYATENLVTEVLIHPQTNTLLQCMRNLLASFTKHRHIIHAGYTFSGNGSWILQDGTFSLADFLDAFSEHEVQRVLRAYENSVTVDINCAGVGEWSTSRLSKEACTRSCRVRLNPDDVLTAGVPAITSFTSYVGQYLVSQTLDQLMEPSDVVGNIRFSHPTLYVFPGGQGDAALFGINGFNMLVDGGFARKACFWDFARHLDRLDAVLMTRINNSNVGGMSSVLRKKREMHVYPQIGHFFCNLIERKNLNSPDGDKDLDPLILNLTDIGHEMMVDLRHINLRAHPCYRDPNPINLYHKVGHGTLDMYVLSPSKDSREVREFLSKWHASDSKLFSGSYRKDSNNLTFPIQNLASICALLVWQPANPEDTITRILFPGSTPQHKIFEGIDRLKHLEFLKHPVCTAKSISPSTSLLTLKDKPATKQKLGLIEEAKKTSEAKKEKRDLIDGKLSKAGEDVVSKPTPQGTPVNQPPKVQPAKIDVKTKKVIENKKIETESKKIEKDLKEHKKEPAIRKDTTKAEKDSESKKVEGYKIKMDNEKAALAKEPRPKPEPKKKETKESKPVKIGRIESTAKSAVRLADKKQKPPVDKKEAMKASPTTPKKSMNGAATKVELSKATPRPISKPSSKTLSSTMPAKSAKDANNRKVVEQKNIEIASAENAAAPASTKAPAKPKVGERKPIGRRPKPISPIKARLPISPTKSTRSTPTTSVKSDKDGIIRKIKGDRGTADSSTVSTPSGIEIDSMTKLADKCLTEKSEDMSLDSIESKVLADLKEEREVVEEIEAVLQKAERIEGARRDDHLEGDDDITAEATDKKEDDMTEDDVTADIEEMPKKESSRKTSHELTEEDEYLIIEKEEIYIEDSVQSGEVEEKHAAGSADAQAATPRIDEVPTKEEDEEEAEEEEEEQEEAEISEEKEKADIPEKQLGLAEEKLQETEEPEKLASSDEVLDEQMKNIIASTAEMVQKTEDKDDSGKKDNEDITKEPSSLSPDKFDSSEKKTTDTDVKPETDQKDRQVPEKLEESHERMSTLESGATTTAPTLPEDERIPLDEIKEVIDEKCLVDQETKPDGGVKVPEPLAAQIPPETKQDAKPFDVRPALHGIQREIVKTPDEVADLPVHEEVDPNLYRMEQPYEKGKEDKPSQAAPPPKEVKEPEVPVVKEQKGVFSFFGKVADKFEKGMDKLTGKSRRDSEKDIDEKSSSKSGSPKEVKAQSIVSPAEFAAEEVSPGLVKVAETSELPENFEKGTPDITQVKVAAIKDTATFLADEIEDLKKTGALPKEPIDMKDEMSAKKLESEAEQPPEPVFETCVLPHAKEKLDRVTSDLEGEEDVEEVEALLAEASKKFQDVKDSLHDSLESLEEKIAEEEMVRAGLPVASQDFVKETLSEVVEKLEDIKPKDLDELSEKKGLEEPEAEVEGDEDFDDEKDEAVVTKDLKGAVRDVGGLLAGSAGILIAEKPKDVIEIVKKVAEVLKKDDFLSPDVLFDSDATEGKGAVSEGEKASEMLSTEAVIIPKKSGATEELPSQEETEELRESRRESTVSLTAQKSDALGELHEETAAEASKIATPTPSPTKDTEKEKMEAMKLCAESLADEPVSSRPKRSIIEDPAKKDVVEAGIEAICVKQTVEKPTRIEGESDQDLKEQNITFDRKVSPVTAEVVIVTPDLSPTSPMLPTDKIHTEDAQAKPEVSDVSQLLPSDILTALQNEGSLEKVIEELVYTKKIKITREIIQHIIIVRRISRYDVIRIIEELIIKRGSLPENVITDMNLLTEDLVSREKREEIEDYINEEYIKNNKKITMKIIEDICILKGVTKRVLNTIIILIVIKRKMRRETLLDLSDKEYTQLDLDESAAEEQDRASETSEISGFEDGERHGITSPSAGKYAEVRSFIENELVLKGQKITPQLIDDVCVAKHIPRRVFIEIIEKILIERQIPRSSMVDISEKEMSELLASEKEDEAVSQPEEDDEDADRSGSSTPDRGQEIASYISDEFISKKKKITVQSFKDICARNDVSVQMLWNLIDNVIEKQKLPRAVVIDISENELTELLAVEDEAIVKEAAGDMELLQAESCDKTEIENNIIEEFVSTKRRITPYIFEDICLRYKASRRIIIEIIETIIVKKHLQRNSILDITDTELSELLAVVEAEDEEETEVGLKSPVKERVRHEDIEEDQLVDGFVNIPSKADVTVEDVLKKVSVELVAKESEKDVDDFEAVEQEYKIYGLSLTPDKELPLTAQSTAAGDKLEDEVEDIVHDHVSDVVEAEEKIVGGASTTDVTSKLEEKSADLSDISETTDAMEKYLVEAKEKPEAVVSKAESVSPLASDIKSSELPIGKKAQEVLDEVLVQDSGVKDATHKVLESEAKLGQGDAISPKAVEVPTSPEIPDNDIKMATAARKPSTTAEPATQVESEKIESEDESKIIEAEIDVSVTKRDSHGVVESTMDSSVVVDTEDVASQPGSASPKEEKSSREISVNEDTPLSSSTVHRMVVTASSEDGGHEMEVCPTGSITFTPDDSLKSSPIKTTPDQDSLRLEKESIHSGISTPERDSISEKSAIGTKDGDKITPEDSLDKSPSGTRDSQDLEDSLDKSDLVKLKETKAAERLSEEREEAAIDQISEPSKAVDKESKSLNAADKIIPTSLESVDVSAPVTGIKDEIPEKVDVIDTDTTVEQLESTKVSSQTPLEKADILKTPSSLASEIQSATEQEIATRLSDSSVIIDRKDAGEPIVPTKTPSPSYDEDYGSEEIHDRPKRSSVFDETVSMKHDDESEVKSPTKVSPTATIQESKDEKVQSGVPSHDISPSDAERSRATSVSSDTKHIVDDHEGQKILDLSDTVKSLELGKDEDKTTIQVEDLHVTKPTDKISPTTADIKLDAEKEPLEHVTSPSIDSKKHSPVDLKEPTDTVRSPSLVDDESESAKVVTDKLEQVTAESVGKGLTDTSTKSPTDDSTSTGKIDEKQKDGESIGRSRSSSIAIETQDEKGKISQPRLSIVEGGDHDHLELIGHSKSPSVTSEIQDEIEVVEDFKPSTVVTEKPDAEGKKVSDSPQSPTIALEQQDEKETSDRSKSSSPAGEKEFTDRARSTSITPAVPERKASVDQSRLESVAVEKEAVKGAIDGSKMVSVMDDKEDDKESIGSSKAPSVAGDKEDEKEHIDRSRSASIAAEKQDEKESLDRSRSPSVVVGKLDEKETTDRSKSPSVTSEKGDEKEFVDRSRSPSVAIEKQDEKETIDRSKSPSVASEKGEEKESIDRSRSPSVVAEKLDVKDASDRSRSPSIATGKVDEKETIDRSKSPSVASEKEDVKELIDRSRSSSIVGEKHDVKEAIDRSKSPSVASEKGDEKESVDRAKSPSLASEKGDEKESIDRSRSPSVVADKHDVKDAIDRSKSPSVASEKGDEKESIDRSRSPSVVADKHDVKDAIDRSKSPSVVSEKGDEKESIDRSRSPSVVADKHDVKEAIDRSKSPSVASEKGDEKESIDRSRSPSVVADKHDVKDAIDRSKSPSVASEKGDEKESIDRSRSPSVVADKHDVKDAIDRSKSPSVASEKGDEKESIDRSRSPSVITDKLDVKDVSDRSRSASVETDKIHEKEAIDRSKSPSVTSEKEDEKESIERSRSPSVVTGKQDEKETIDGSKSPSVPSEKESIDRSRSPSVVAEKHDVKDSTDRSKSPSVASEKGDEKESIDRSRSPSIVAEKHDGKDAIDRSKSPSVASEKGDEKESIVHSGSPSVVSGKEDEKETIDRSKSPSLASEKGDEKELIDRSRSSSVATEKREEKETTDGSKSPSVASEKGDEKELIDRSRSPSVATEKQVEKETIDRSKSPSIASEKGDAKETIDRSRSPSVVAEKLDVKDTSDHSRSPSVASEKGDEKETIDRSRSSSVVAEKLDVKDASDRSRSPSVVAEKPDVKDAIDRSKSPSVASEKGDDKETIARSKSPSVASEKGDEKETIPRSKSPSVASEKEDEKDTIDRSRSPSVVAEKPDVKDAIDRSKSPSVASEKEHEKEATDRSKSPSIASEKEGERESIDRSRSPSVATEKHGEKEDEKGLVSRSRSTSLTPDKQEEKESHDRSKSPSVASEKDDGKEFIDRSRSASLAPEAHDTKESTDRSRSPSVVAEKLDEKASIDRSKSPSVASEKESIARSRSASIASEKQDEKESPDHSISPSVAGENEDAKDSIDRSRSPSVVTEKQPEKETTDRSKSPSIASEKGDEKASIDRSRSASVTTEKHDEKESVDHPKSPSVTSEKELIDRSRSPSIAGEKQVETSLLERSRSPSLVGEKPSEKESATRSRSSSVTIEKSDEKELRDESETRALSPAKQDEKETIAGFKALGTLPEKEDAKESLEHSKSSSIAGDKPSEKEPVDLSISLSTAVEKTEEQSRSPSAGVEKHDGVESIHSSKSPSVAGEKQDVKELSDREVSPTVSEGKPDVLETADRSKSPSVAGEKQDVKELSDREVSPTVSEGKPDVLETADRSKSPSVAGDEPDRSRSSSIAGEKQSVDRSRSASIVSEKPDAKESLDGSKSPSAVGGKHDETGFSDRTRSGSIVGERQEAKEMIDRSRTSSIADERLDDKESIGRSRSASIAVGKLDEKETIGRSRSASIAVGQQEKELIDRSRSSSVVAEKQEEEEETVDRSRSGSIIVEKPEHRETIDRSRSGSVVAEKHEDPALVDRSRSGSVVAEKHEEKDTVDRSRSGSVIAEKQEEKGTVDRSRSGSVIAEKQEEKDTVARSRSGSVVAEKQEEKHSVDRSRSGSIIAEKQEEVSVDRSRSSSIVAEKQTEEFERSRLPSIASEKTVDKTAADGSRSASISPQEHIEKVLAGVSESSITVAATQKDGSTVHSRSSSITGGKQDAEQVVDHSRSPSILSDNQDKVDLSVRAESPETADADHEKTGSPDSSKPADIKKPADATESHVMPTQQPAEAIDDKLPKDSTKLEKDAADEPIDLSSTASTGTESSSYDAGKRASIVDTHIIAKRSLDASKESVPSVTAVQDCKLDESDAVQAMQKLAETIADKSLACDMKDGGGLHDVETVEHEIAHDKSRSSSLFDAGEKTPKSRSPTASLIEDEVPEVSKPSDQATITKEDVSRKSSMAEISHDTLDQLPSDSKKFCTMELEGALTERGSVEIAQDIAGRFAKDYHTTSEKMAEIVEYIMNKYIAKKERISPHIVEEIVTLYSISKHIILDLIEAIIIEKNVPRDVIVSFPKDDETKVSDIVSEDDHVDVIDIPPAKQLEIETRIHQEFVTKNKKITSLVINELAAMTFISRHIIIMIIQKMVRDQKGLTADLLESGILDESMTKTVQSGTTHEQSPEPESVKSHESSVHDDGHSGSHLPSGTGDDVSHSDKVSEDAPMISDSKRMEIENYVMEECVKKRIKINLLVFEQIIMRMGVPRSALLSVIEKIILSGKVPRAEMIDDAIYDEVERASDRVSESEDKGSKEFMSSRDRLMELSGKSTPDPKSSGYSTPEVRHYDDKYGKGMVSYSNDYESPFHKAFVGGMTEIRTTHITTLSGKSTPDYSVRGETPESLSESTSQTKLEEKFGLETVTTSEKTSTSVHKTDVTSTTGTTTTTTVDLVTEPAKLSTKLAPSKEDPHAESDEDEQVVIKKVITTEIIEETRPVTEITIHKQEIVDQPPVMTTKTIESSSSDKHDDYEVHTISRTVQETGSPETIEIVTVKTIETVVMDDVSPETIMSKLGSLDGTKDLSVTEHTEGDVKTVTTTVTMTTESDREISPQKIVEKIVGQSSGSKELDKVGDESYTSTQVISKVTYTAPIDSQQTDKVTADHKEETAASTATLTSGGQKKSDLETSATDSAGHVEKSKSAGPTLSERIGLEKLEHPRSPVIKDLISDERSFTGRMSPDVSSGRDSQQGGSSIHSATDVPGSPMFRDSGMGYGQMSGRSTPDKRGPSRSSTATPEGVRSNEVIRTTITTTRTMSDEGDIITTTMEITETTNEKGETIILAEKTDVKVEDRIISEDMSKSTLSSGFEALKAPSDYTGEAADADQVSPRSDHSSVQSRAGTHIWGGSEERYTYSDDDVPGSPLSTTSQVGYSPQSTYPFEDHSSDKGSSRKSMEFSVADMSASFYGELPDLPPRVTTIKTTHLDGSDSEAPGSSAPAESDFSFKKFTVAKEFAGTARDGQSDGKKYIDEADLDFEKALTEPKETKAEKEVSSVVGTSSSSSQSQIEDKKSEPKSDSKKDPLAGWGSPLGLPSPKPPRKFNLRTVARPSDNVVEESQDSINFDPIQDWGEPLRLPSPAPVVDEGSNKGAPSTPKKERKQPKKIISENIKNRKRSESPAKNDKKSKDAKTKIQPVYIDLTYVPHHGNSYYTSVEFFKRVRARYYVFSGTEPSREVYDALLDAKKTWEDKDLEVTMIPTYDTDTLGYWVADNEEALAANHIDLSPSASRCTINLQDHETSCSAYRLEF